MENGPRNGGKSWNMVSTLAENSQHGLGGRGVVRSNVGGHGIRVGVGFRKMDHWIFAEAQDAGRQTLELQKYSRCSLGVLLFWEVYNSVSGTLKGVPQDAMQTVQIT